MDPSSARIEWDGLLPGAEVGALVLMASGFALPEGQHVVETYRVVKRLGEGGMGQVLAVQLLGTQDDTTYALKVVGRAVLRGGGSSPGAVDPETEAEAEKQARWFAELLRSEAAKQEVAQRHGVAVARLFALVRFGDGSLGLRMELARGHSLEAQIAQQKRRRDSAPDAPRAIRAVRKLLSQLRRLHEMVRPDSPFGFVHSDIKPGNVFVDDNDPSDVIATLLDFGVATAGQALEQNLALSRGRSRKTLVLEHTGGTLGYVPPYHFTMQATPLSDVYASLVILYELITLGLPWDMGPLHGRPGVREVEAAMLRGPRPVRAVRPSIPDDEAVTLDAFFTKEFGALNDLASHASQALAMNDEDVRRAIGDRLRALARDYQPRLDRLLAGLGPTRRTMRTSAPPAEPEPTPDELATRPTMLSDGEPGGLEAPSALAPSALESWTDDSAVPRGGPPSVVMNPDPVSRTTMDGEMRWGDSIMPGALSDERPASPMNPDRTRGGRGPLVAALIAVPLIAVGAWFGWRATHAGTTAAIAPTTNTVADAAVVATAPDASAPDANAVVAVADAAAAVEHATVTLEPGSVHVVEPPPGERPASEHGGGEHGGSSEHGGGTGGAGGGEHCRCVAPARGVMVVAHGGSLHGEAALCVTASAMPQRPGHFVGNGDLPPGLADAHATLACRGPGSFELAVLSYPTGHGEAALYECSRTDTAASSMLTGPLPNNPTTPPTHVAAPNPPPANPVPAGPANAALPGVSFTPLPGLHPSGGDPSTPHPGTDEPHTESPPPAHHSDDAGG